MLMLPGFTISKQLCECQHSLLFSAIRDNDQKPVIIKLLKDTHPSAEQLARFKREFQITQMLHQYTGIINVYDILKVDNSLAIIEEDFGGRSLDQIIGTQCLSVTNFLRIAIKITTALKEIHDAHIIHKDVTPGNIVWNQETHEIKFIDFGISATLSYEDPDISNLNILEGTLQYISPEQTGRMNRRVDYRTDFYSLGITFYQLLTGQPPFISNDRLELIHHHIAKKATPLNEMNSNIPKPVADIVAKLMAKMAEERYQSTYGLLYDLNQCLDQLTKTGKIEPFQLASHDISTRLIISEKMYGRDHEIETLINTYDEACQGSCRLMLVSGYAGIGKSTLVYELNKLLVQNHAYFIKGKYEQFKQNIPYAGLAQALNDWASKILMESPETIYQWRDKLKKVLGANSGILTNIAPGFTELLGPSTEPAVMPTLETRNRFNWVIIKCLQALANKKQPLVIFLDDLQWADEPSLQVLEKFFENLESKYIFIVGAYRDNEITKSHILNLTLDRLHKLNIPISHLNLKPLQLNHVSQMVADALQKTPEEVAPLANIIYDKAQGNPFFTNQLLFSLYREAAIYLDTKQQSWKWNIDEIVQKKVTDNVVDLMKNKIIHLRNETRQILQLAACIGSTFDLKNLSTIKQVSEKTIAKSLETALQHGLIYTYDPHYKYIEAFETQIPNISYSFLHDKIQQAAYLEIPETERIKNHYKIGKILLQQTPVEILPDHIFEIIHHINQAESLINTEEEIYQFIQLNAMAGRRAKNSAAFEDALHYWTRAKSKLNINDWQQHYELAKDIYQNLADCLYIAGDDDAADLLIKEELRYCKTNLEKSQIYCAQVTQYTTGKKMERAIQVGLNGLATLGVQINENPSKFTVIKSLLDCKKQLKGRSIAQLIDEPILHDQKILSIIQLLVKTLPATFFTAKRNLAATIILKATALSLQHGNSPESAAAYALYANLLGAVLGKYKEGYEFGKLSIVLNTKFNDSIYRCQILSLNAFVINPWNVPWQSITDDCEKAIAAGLQSGDLYWTASSCCAAICNDPSSPQSVVIAGLNKYLTIIAQTHYEDMWASTKIRLQFRLNLFGKTKSLLSLNDDTFSEDDCLTKMINSNYMSGITSFYLYKAIIAYSYGEYKIALDTIEKTDKTLSSLLGFANQAEQCFYYFLILTACYPTLSPWQKILARLRMHKNLKQMQHWANHYPPNFRQRELLMRAELARIDNDVMMATRFYESAIEASKLGNTLGIEALCYELASTLHLACGHHTIAKILMNEAHYIYTYLQCNAKVKYLEKIYPQLFLREQNKLSSTSEQTINPMDWRTTESTSGVKLDLEAIIKASQTISSTMVLDDLLRKMMRIVMENVGAENGWLLLQKNGKWFIEAHGSMNKKNIEVESQSIENFPVSLINAVTNTHKPWLLSDELINEKYHNDAYLQRVKPKSALCFPLLNKGELSGILYLENNLLQHAFTHDHLRVLDIMSSQMAISIDNARLYTHMTRLNRSYERFIPKEFLSLLGKESITDVVIGDNIQKDMTVMFSDIRSFTALSETLSPEENFRFINQLLEYLVPVIHRHHGFVDKYMGDGIMALFPASADSAVEAAIAMLKAVRKYNASHANPSHRAIDIGIGLNSGLLMLGTVGEKRRMEGTVISDAVNVASRIQTLTKQYGTYLIITDNTYQRLQSTNRYSIRKLDHTIVRGKSKPIAIYEVFDIDSPSTRQLKQQTIESFEKAVYLYHEKKYDDALALFSNVIEINPHDAVAMQWKLIVQDTLNKNSGSCY